MADRGDHLHEVLDGYAKFLQEKNLALDKHQPYLVHWVREFLLFARTHAGYSFEQTLERFLADARGVELWVAAPRGRHPKLSLSQEKPGIPLELPID